MGEQVERIKVVFRFIYIWCSDDWKLMKIEGEEMCWSRFSWTYKSVVTVQEFASSTRCRSVERHFFWPQDVFHPKCHPLCLMGDLCIVIMMIMMIIWENYPQNICQRCFSSYLFFFLSGHYSDQKSEGSQVSKVTLCVEIQKGHWVTQWLT